MDLFPVQHMWLHRSTCLTKVIIFYTIARLSKPITIISTRSTCHWNSYGEELNPQFHMFLHRLSYLFLSFVTDPNAQTANKNSLERHSVLLDDGFLLSIVSAPAAKSDWITPAQMWKKTFFFSNPPGSVSASKDVTCTSSLWPVFFANNEFPWRVNIYTISFFARCLSL